MTFQPHNSNEMNH